MSRILVLLMLASLCSGWQKKGKQPKLPDVALLEITCHRSSGDIFVDGRLRVQSPKPIQKLHLVIDFLGSDKQLLQTKRGPVESEYLEPGEETEFHLRVADPVRAVLYSVRAEDGDGRDLRVEKAGPFPIE
ncbi:MAG: hypothetical protein NZV14_16235 [Bryobacteraceae bacterium]|nr:hypothetical protein [Bryobacteraceae bacterium]MDW8379711.1 hypothetical protein [Bryobacterales bacterium]